MRILFFIFFLVFSLNLKAQIKTWFDLFTTNRLKYIISSQNKIYAAAKNAMLIYTPSSGLLERLSAQGPLNDTAVSSLYAYDNKVIIGYSSGNIDIIQNNQIINLPSIKNNFLLPPQDKKINAFAVYENMLWIATNYGYTILNLQNLIFDHTQYLIDSLGEYIKIIDIALFSSQVFLLTKDGIHFTELNNITNFYSWNYIPINNSKKICILNNNLYVLTYDNNLSKIYKFSASNLNLIHSQQGYYNLKIIEDKLFLLGNKVIVLDTNGIILNQYLTYSFGNKIKANDITKLNGSFYIADRFLSMVKDFNQKIQINSIFSDNINAIKAHKDKVFILHKTDSIDRTYGYRAVISIINNKGSIELFSTNQVNEFLSLAIDPIDDEHWFLSSDSVGLVEINNRQITKVYTPQNSILNVNNNYIKISYLKFDQDGNLWILYNSADYPLIKLLADGSWEIIESSAIAKDKSFSRFIFTKQGFLYAPVKDAGLFAIDLNTDQAKVFYPYYRIGSLIYDIVEDKKGTLWFSTNDGLGYLTMQDFNNPDFKAVRPLVQVSLNDTLTYVYLMDNTRCVRIIVDEGNYKWVATTLFGIVALKPDGLSEEAHFNVNNHTIVSNKIFDIGYNKEKGILYFTTDQGIIAYNSNVTVGQKNFNNVKIYPNPVRPEYYGHITITGLMNKTLIKITDLNGNIVYETRSNGGTVVWDGQTLNGKYPHSGVYLIICTDEQGKEKYVGKLLIIR